MFWSGRLLSDNKWEVIVKIADIDPMVTEFDAGAGKRKVGNWSFVDFIDPDGVDVRAVSHYNMTLVAFKRDVSGRWHVYPISIGWGSVSDQNGVNALLAGSGWRYRRDAKGGGPRYVRVG